MQALLTIYLLIYLFLLLYYTYFLGKSKIIIKKTKTKRYI